MQQHPLLHQVLQQRLMQQMQQFQQQPQQQGAGGIAPQGWGNQGIGSGFGADPYAAWAQQGQSAYGAGQPQGGPQGVPGFTVH
jgi:hypothetical protein